MKPRKQRIVDDLVYMLQLRSAHGRQLYPNNLDLQHMDQIGYLIGIISECALADTTVERHLTRVIAELKDSK
jgi:hypothetical protein